MKTSIRDLDLKGKRVLLRVDFNVPLNENGVITDTTRITEALPTINYILKQGAKLVVMSHLGRPEGKIDLKYSLLPVARKLIELLINKVYFATDTIGPDAKEKAAKLKPGELLLLENLRFSPDEEDNSPDFAMQLSKFGEIYVDDAFGTAHRKHASNYGVAKLLPNAIGLLMEKEIKNITGTISNPSHPFLAIIGGAKIKDKIKLTKYLIEKADTILIGGGMSYTFLKAEGYNIGKSLVDEENISYAKEMIDLANKLNKKLLLPIDNVCATLLSETAKTKIFKSDKILDNYGCYDIGPKTIKMYIKEIKKAATIIWNGPMGVFEFKNFSKGTNKIAKAVANIKGKTIVGGGDSVAAIKNLKLERKISHISTGGGASLKLMEGTSLPAIDIISDKE